MKFGFMPGLGKTVAIFVLRQFQEKHLAKNRKLAFVVLEMMCCHLLALKCSLCRLCTTKPEIKLESITPTVMNLELKLEFIKVNT